MTNKLTVNVDFRRLEEKIQHHKKMQSFYRDYMKAVILVESFDNIESQLQHDEVKFCSIGTCKQVVNNDFTNSSGMCPAHEWKIARHKEERDYLGD